MVNGVSSANIAMGPVKTIELLDPRTKTVKKFTNTQEAVDKYIKDVNAAELETKGNAALGAISLATTGFFVRLLYDGIKRSKFYFGMAAATGLFTGLVSYGVIAALNYKKNICKVANNFMEDSEKKFKQNDSNGLKFSDYVNKVAQEKEKAYETVKS